MTDELSHDARGFLDAALRAEPDLGDESRRRMRARMLATIGAAVVIASPEPIAKASLEAATTKAAVPAKTFLTGATLLKSVVALLLVGGVAFGVTQAMTDNRTTTTTARPSTTAPSIMPSVSPPLAEPPLAEPPLVTRRADDLPSVTSPSRPRAARIALPPAGTSPSASAEPSIGSDTTFGETLTLLDRARRAIAEHDSAEALTTLRRLDKLPGSEAFAEERAALRIVALCTGGRADEAGKALPEFHAAFPRSLQAERIARACGVR